MPFTPFHMGPGLALKAAAGRRLGWLAEPETLAPGPMLAGALLGTFSHVALDSIMHADITPLAPWSQANGLMALIPIDTLHQACLAAALVGALGWVARGWLTRRISPRP